MRRRPSGRPLALGGLLIAVSVWSTGTTRAGENLDFASGGQIRDMFWDSRLFDGTPGYSGALRWFHNPSGKPTGVSQVAFEASLEASFDAWEAADDGLPEEPLVPVFVFGGQTGVTDVFALDGVNAIGWQAGAPGGTLASTPCWVLTEPTTTLADGAGNTVMPVSGGSPIPFPGPSGVTYPAGAIIDCGMRFDSVDAWSTSDPASPSAFDVQSVGTHEVGHFIGISHSTLGDFTGINPMSATMLPFAAAGDTTFRTLEADDKASVLRTYARNRAGGPLPQTVGGRATITLVLLKGGSCEPATGVSVVAYPTATGINGVNRIESFSGSQFRAGMPHEPYNGSVTLNVPPLPAGQTYTIYARTLEDGTGALSAQRYNYTTINSNLVDPATKSRTFDQLATIAATTPGQSIELGSIGLLGCWVPNPASPVNLVANAITAPANAVKGGHIAVTSSFSNQGSAPSDPFEAGIYFSTDSTITADDIFTGFHCAVPGLAPGGSGTCDGSVAVPGGVVPGTYYVGLLVDRHNQIIESVELDNGVPAGNATVVERNPLDPIVNGSFETGDLAGWTVKELIAASNPSLPLSARPAGVEYPASTFIAWPYVLDYFTSQPTDGLYAALHDFNGNDPATSGDSQYINRRELSQDVTLPPGTTTLEFDYRAAWELFRFESTRDRTFHVAIEPPGGGAALLEQTILVAPNLTIEEDTDNPTGGEGDYPPGVVDLSAFAGQSIRLKFVWNIPEPGTGFGFFQLDNIRLNATPVSNTAPAVTITAPDSGAGFTAGAAIGFSGTAVDAEDGTISGSLSWSSDRDGAIGSGANVSTAALSVGTHTITASVTDSGGLNGSDSVSIAVAAAVPNTPPVVTITAPADGASFTAGALVFTGIATDAEDGTISGSLSWSSSRDGVIGTGASVSTSALSGGTHVVTASVVDAGGLNGSAAITVHVDVVNLAAGDFSTARGTIGSGTSFRDTWAEDDVYQVLTEETQGGNPARRRSLLEHTWVFNVSAGAQYVFAVSAFRSGTEDAFAFSYSRDNAAYVPMVTVTATSDDDQSQTYVFPADVSGTLYVRVQDTDSTAGHVQLDSVYVDYLAVTSLAAGGSLTAPVVSIASPTDGAVFTEGASVSFAGTASDGEDGELSAGLQWTSSITGTIGAGAAFATTALTPGTHTITAAVTDSDGLQGSASISITVLGNAGVVLSAATYKLKGVQHADLTWTGANTTTVTIARNGVVVATVANPGPGGGTYTDNLGVKGSGTYTYQVCETGTGGACSNVVTATF